MYIVERDFTFCAAHYLPGHEKCGKMHGHNYKVIVRLRGNEMQTKDGMLVDFGEMKKIVSDYLGRLDHKTLNEVMAHVPTAEEIARLIYGDLEIRFKALLDSVTVQETDNCRVTYRK